MKPVQRNINLLVFKIAGGATGQDGIGLQAVKGGDFTGQGSQRGDLQIFFVFRLLQLGVASPERFRFVVQLIKAGNLGQHASIRTHDSGNAHQAECGADDQHVKVIDGNLDLVELALSVASNEKNVKPFTQ